MSVFSSRTISGDSDTVCLIISAEAYLEQTEPRSANQRASLVDLVDKDNGGNVHFSAGHGTEYGSGLRHL